MGSGNLLNFINKRLTFGFQADVDGDQNVKGYNINTFGPTEEDWQALPIIINGGVL